MSTSGDGSPPPKPSAAPLAPGFRFHPTDEELVSYYLKRKVLSKPFAVDAISDVDLYKVEPWDLPGKSRIQSRDMEWYFFGILDRKYSNKSKTNRATGQGYWKTTGKDRPVRRAGRTVGMKKTLVFHVGRAPKGERTNWVMHEYRLEDDDLARAGVPQDAYVVCRIFQKNGPGPQNGAQYGAPFVEAEWEDDENVALGWGLGGGDILIGDDGNRDNPSEQEGQHMDIQNEITAHPLGSNDEQNIVASSGEPNSHPTEVPPNEIICQLNEDIYLPELDDDMELGAPTGTSGLFISPQSPPMDDFLELNDFAKPLDAGENILQDPLVQNEQAFSSPCNCNSNLEGLQSVELLNTLECELQAPKQEASTFVDDDFYQELGDIFHTNGGERTDDDTLYFDALALQHGIEQDGFVEMTDILDPITSKSSGSDPLEELVAYFDATEDHNTQSTSLDYSEFLDFNSLDATGIWDEGDGVAKPSALSSKQLTNVNDEAAASSLVVSTNTGKKSLESSGSPESPDVGYGHAPDKSIKGRLISMLGSISSPPALAAEPKARGPNPSAATSSSIHITAGMIHINGMRMYGSQQPWSSGPKSKDVGFLLSYDSARADIRSNLPGSTRVGKMHCSSVSVVVRSGYCLSFLSVLFLAVFFKMGVIYLCQVK